MRELRQIPADLASAHTVATFIYCNSKVKSKHNAIVTGLKTALVELDDFASGTSSRSTKLIHGGVRYLQKAIMQLDVDQYNMVKEALHERSNMLEVAPHLTHPLPIMLPVYQYVLQAGVVPADGPGGGGGCL